MEADILQATVTLVSKLIEVREVGFDQLADVLSAVFSTLVSLVSAPSAGCSVEPTPEPTCGHTGEAVPAIDPKKSVSDNGIICLCCGSKFLVLKRHIRTSHGMTPAQYRIMWGLEDDYPLIAPNYSENRSKMAKGQGLGTSGNRRQKSSLMGRRGRKNSGLQREG